MDKNMQMRHTGEESVNNSQLTPRVILECKPLYDAVLIVMTAALTIKEAYGDFREPDQINGQIQLYSDSTMVI